MSKTVALLPMKAHSERVSGKNFRELGGRPLFRWILDSLLAVDEVDQVVINTDARALLEKAGTKESSRLIIRDRKAELCGDLVSMNKILEDDITNVPADRYVMTHTTNPLLDAATIKAALVKLAAAPDHDSLFTVNRIQTRFYRSDGSAVNHDPDNLVRTQDLEPWFEENSCLYVFTATSFSTTGARIGVSPMMMETPPLESLDIDEPHDWDLVEALVQMKSR